MAFKKIVFIFFLLFLPQKIFAREYFFGETEGITGIFFLDYFLIPFVAALIVFIIFRKQFIGLTKKMEKSKEESLKE